MNHITTRCRVLGVAARVLGALLLLTLLVAGARASGGPVLVLGDSLSAGYGLRLEEGWVALLEQRLRAAGYPQAVVNASISGDTTKGGASRVGAALERHRPSVVVVELGGNDGLRGISVDETRSNLESIVAAVREAGARVLLVGMQIPPNLGPRYTRAFAAIYPALAEQQGLALVPFFLDGVGGHAELMQDDGLHPTAEAQPRLLDNVWPHLEPLLREAS
ncbi:MAG: arylesterase [Ectothiorhodospiraceae bacterium]|nr:arylesterase [Ectothiorhodospiraceae bacterium]